MYEKSKIIEEITKNLSNLSEIDLNEIKNSICSIEERSTRSTILNEGTKLTFKDNKAILTKFLEIVDKIDVWYNNSFYSDIRVQLGILRPSDINTTKVFIKDLLDDAKEDNPVFQEVVSNIVKFVSNSKMSIVFTHDFTGLYKGGNIDYYIRFVDGVKPEKHSFCITNFITATGDIIDKCKSISVKSHDIQKITWRRLQDILAIIGDKDAIDRKIPDEHDIITVNKVNSDFVEHINHCLNLDGHNNRDEVSITRNLRNIINDKRFDRFMKMLISDCLESNHLKESLASLFPFLETIINYVPIACIPIIFKHCSDESIIANRSVNVKKAKYNTLSNILIPDKGDPSNLYMSNILEFTKDLVNRLPPSTIPETIANFIINTDLDNLNSRTMGFMDKYSEMMGKNPIDPSLLQEKAITHQYTDINQVPAELRGNVQYKTQTKRC